MRAWRLAKQRFALDRTGAGGLVEAGRWHQLGTPSLYAGLTPEIAVLEKLVHTGRHLPIDLVLVELRLPDEADRYERPALSDLPAGWDDKPSGDASADYGTRFLRQARALVLILPSAVLPEASIILINPLHPAFGQVQMNVLRRFSFDDRLRSGS